MNCPLCKSEPVECVDSVDAGLLAEQYLKQLQVEVSGEFKGVSKIDFMRCGECDLQFFDPQITGSENFYDCLQNFDWYYQEEKSEYEFAGSQVKETDSLLEVGAGKGAFTKFIKTPVYTGLELSAKAAELACVKGLIVKAQFLDQHATEHPGIYDVVCAFQVLEHVADVGGFIGDALKCLKPGGKLIFSVPSDDGFVGRQENALLNMPPHHVTRWSHKALRSVAEIFDLQLLVLEQESLAAIHRGPYAESLALNGASRLVGRKPALLDFSWKWKLAYRLSRFTVGGIKKRLSANGDLPLGHSVTAVYLKR